MSIRSAPRSPNVQSMFDASTHLTTARAGYVVSLLLTPGVDWRGCSKRMVFDGADDALHGKVPFRSARLRVATLDELLVALHEAESASSEGRR